MNKQRREKIGKLKARIQSTKIELKQVSSELSSILNEEQDAFDNMPEGLQSSYRGMCSEDAIDSMEEASEKLDNADNPDDCRHISVNQLQKYPSDKETGKRIARYNSGIKEVI